MDFPPMWFTDLILETYDYLFPPKPNTSPKLPIPVLPPSPTPGNHNSSPSR